MLGSSEALAARVRRREQSEHASYNSVARKTCSYALLRFCIGSFILKYMYVFRTIVLAAVVGRPAYQFIDALYTSS